MEEVIGMCAALDLAMQWLYSWQNAAASGIPLKEA